MSPHPALAPVADRCAHCPHPGPLPTGTVCACGHHESDHGFDGACRTTLEDCGCWQFLPRIVTTAAASVLVEAVVKQPPPQTYRSPAPMGAVVSPAPAPATRVQLVSVAPTFDTMEWLRAALDAHRPKNVAEVRVVIVLASDRYRIEMRYHDGRGRELYVDAGALRARGPYPDCSDVVDAVALQALCDRREELL